MSRCEVLWADSGERKRDVMRVQAMLDWAAMLAARPAYSEDAEARSRIPGNATLGRKWAKRSETLEL